MNEYPSEKLLAKTTAIIISGSLASAYSKD